MFLELRLQAQVLVERCATHGRSRPRGCRRPAHHQRQGVGAQAAIEGVSLVECFKRRGGRVQCAIKVSLPAPPVSVSVFLVRMYVVLIGVEVTGVVTVVPVAVATEVLRLAVALVTEACVASTDVKNARPEAAAMAPL